MLSITPSYLGIKLQLFEIVALTTSTLGTKILRPTVESKRDVINSTLFFFGLKIVTFRNHGLKAQYCYKKIVKMKNKWLMRKNRRCREIVLCQVLHLRYELKNWLSMEKGDA